MQVRPRSLEIEVDDLEGAYAHDWLPEKIVEWEQVDCRDERRDVSSDVGERSRI